MTEKKHIAKIYDFSKTNWDEALWDSDYWDGESEELINSWAEEIISDISFPETINAGAGELNFRLAREFTDFGEGVDVELRNRVKVYAYDVDAVNGTLIYTGYISKYSPIYDGGKQYLSITCLPYSAELANIVLSDGGVTTLTYNSYDPADMLKDIIDVYRTLGGTVNYSADSITDTGTTVSYTFKNITALEAIEKVVQLCPENWYFFIDADSTIYLQRHNSENETPTHCLKIGQHVSYVSATTDLESVVNEAYFVGAETDGEQLYRKKSSSGSVTAYGRQGEKLADARVSLADTADTFMSRLLDERDVPKQTFTVMVVDNNGTDSNLGYDIESISIGDTVEIKGLFSRDIDVTRWDVATWDSDYWDATRAYNLTKPQVVIKKRYGKNILELGLAYKIPPVTKRIEDIARNLDVESSLSIPSSPTAA